MLMRRRMIWWPTLGGWALLSVLVVALIVGCARRAVDFLAMQAPAHGSDGRGAGTLIVEGWLDEPALDLAVEVFRRGHYLRVVATGGPIPLRDDPARFGSYAARAAAWLRSHGLAAVDVIAVPAPPTDRDRTWRSAAAVQQWADGAGVSLDAVDVVTAGLHARRSRSVYRLALGDSAEVGVIGLPIGDFDTARWWRSSIGTKEVMSEVLSLAWTDCCFWPEPPSR